MKSDNWDQLFILHGSRTWPFLSWTTFMNAKDVSCNFPLDHVSVSVSNRDPCCSFRLCNMSWLLNILRADLRDLLSDHIALVTYSGKLMTNILQNFISELLKMYLAPTKSELELKLPATQAETSFLRLVLLLVFFILIAVLTLSPLV